MGGFRLSKLFLFLFPVFLLIRLFLPAGSARAMDIFIKDTAKILESDRVQQEAAKLPYHVLLYTAKELPKIKGAGGDVTLDVGDDLYKLLYRFQNGDYKNQGLIIGINADSRYLFLQYGSGVALTREEAKQAGDEFRRVVASKGYTEGVLAALASLEKTLTSKGVMGAQNPLGQLLPWIIGGIVVIVVAGGGWLLYVRRKKAQQSPAPEEEST